MAKSDLTRCIWCHQTYPPAEASREHLLPDFLGADLLLPNGAVCKACNNLLNTQLDQPLKLILQPLVTFFGVCGSKRDTVSAAQVQVPSARGPVTAVMAPGGAIMPPRRMRLARVQEGREVLEEWVVHPEEADGLLAERAKKLDILDVEIAQVQMGEPSAQLRGKAGTLKRSAVRAGVNLIALRVPELLELRPVADAQRYVLDENGNEPDLQGEASQPLMKGTFASTDCRLEHTILVSAAPYGPAVLELRLFGDIFCRVTIADQWVGPHVRLVEHLVDLRVRDS